MVDAGGEGDLGRLEGVVGGEVDGEEEDPALVGTVWGSHDGCLGKKFYNNNTDRQAEGQGYKVVNKLKFLTKCISL